MQAIALFLVQRMCAHSVFIFIPLFIVGIAMLGQSFVHEATIQLAGIGDVREKELVVGRHIIGGANFTTFQSPDGLD